MDVRLDLRQIVLNEDPAPLSKGAHLQIFGHICCGQTVANLSYCSALQWYLYVSVTDIVTFS